MISIISYDFKNILINVILLHLHNTVYVLSKKQYHDLNLSTNIDTIKFSL